MVNIAAFFKEPGMHSYPFNKQEFWYAYIELSDEIAKRGGQLFFVRTNKTYQGNGVFTESWQFQDDVLVSTGKITADVVYDKGEFNNIDENVAMLNHMQINTVCTDKYKTFESFPTLSPQTHLVHDEEALEQALKSIHGKVKVIKPLDLEEGIGVFIGDNSYLRRCKREYPVIVQEFLDSTSGIPGIYNGTHDYRVMVMNGEVIGSFLRTPPPGELKTNVAQGGILRPVENKDIPQNIYPIVEEVDAAFLQYGERFYGIDLAFTNHGPKIIELNSRPGLVSNFHHPLFRTVKEKLAEQLIRIASK